MAKAFNNQTPVGIIKPFAGSIAPRGYLFCTGEPLDAITYPELLSLFNTIGTIYGGSGVDNFNLPDLRGRVLAGRDVDYGEGLAYRLTSAGSGLDSSVLGNGAGSINRGAEAHTLSVSEMPSHTHTAPYNGNGTGGVPSVGYASGDFGTVVGNIRANNPTGNSAAHSSTQPTAIINYIIKY